MSWLKDLCLFGGATASVITLVLVAATPPTTVRTPTNASPPVHATAVSSTSSAATVGVAASSDSGAWAHGLIGQFISRSTNGVAPETPPPAFDATATPTTLRPVVPSTAVPVATVVSPIARNVATLGQAAAASPANRLGSTVPDDVRRWEPYIDKYASQYRIDPNLVAAVMMTESAGNPLALSSKGAVGLMQVMDGPYDPEQNVDEGTRILAADLGRFGGDLDRSLAAYNAGAGAVNQYDGIPPYQETQTYVYLVVNRYYLYSPAG